MTHLISLLYSSSINIKLQICKIEIFGIIFKLILRNLRLNILINKITILRNLSNTIIIQIDFGLTITLTLSKLILLLC